MWPVPPKRTLTHSRLSLLGAGLSGDRGLHQCGPPRSAGLQVRRATCSLATGRRGMSAESWPSAADINMPAGRRSSAISMMTFNLLGYALSPFLCGVIAQAVDLRWGFRTVILAAFVPRATPLARQLVGVAILSEICHDAVPQSSQ
jgi:MFS family permease